jgi:pyruvate dehydrogenase E2 component (dihydrolipoamide acetyltransferase)
MATTTRWEFKLPDIGEGVTEGEIVAWLVKPGDTIKDDQPMVEVMTDKATVTITSPRSGRILETRGKVGEIVAVHAVLVVYELGDAAGAPAVVHGSVTQPPREHANGNGVAPAPKDGKGDGPAATAVGDIRESLPGMGSGSGATFGVRPGQVHGPASGGGAAASQVSAYFKEKPLATPATRKMARELDVDLKRVPPTGPQGRVTKDDVQSFVKGGGIPAKQTPYAGPSASHAAAPPPAAAREAVRIAPPPASQGSQARGVLEERVPFAGMRRKIAQKMAQSTQTAAHFTFVEECDVTKLKELRARFRRPAEARGVKLTYLPFIAKAVALALQRHPILNSALDESTNELVYRKYYNLGIAASTDAGLIVPVVKDVDRLSLLDVAREIERVAGDAKVGKSKVEDLSGSTFTITSLGAQGGLFATPIINFPEVGILGVHRIKERAVVKDGQIVIGEVMLLSLSFDHRIVDGHVGAAFAYEVINYLEDPDRLLFEMG